MNEEKLDRFISFYENSLAVTAENQNGGFEERKERIRFYQSFSKEKMEKMTKEELTQFIGKLWAALMYGNKGYIVEKMIQANHGIESLTKMLSDFIYGKDPIEKRWNYFLEKANYFGPSYMSELLNYYYPDEYVIANSQVIKAFEILDVEGMPHYLYQWTGTKYVEICGLVKQVGEKMKKAGLPCENLLSVDYFLWEIATSDEIEHGEAKKPTELAIASPKEQKSIHAELIEKIVKIGFLLGFDSEKEVKVGTGAIVDAVWKINIGNMGKVMYCFEVQTHGSIDSLIRNFQKASANKAVQRVVAVSDKSQLEKIKKESEDLKSMEILLWEDNDVRNVYDHLSEAFSSINQLGLVPEDF